MATTVRASSGNNGSGSTGTVSIPTGTVDGDLSIVIVHCNSDGALTDNNGTTPWTEDLQFDTGGSSGQTIAVYSRRYVTGDPTTLSFTIGPGGRWGIIAVTFQDPHASVIYDTSPTAVEDATAGTTVDAPDITTTNNGAIHCAIAAPDGTSNAITGVPAGYTDQQKVGTNQALALAYLVITSAGATGAQTFTYTNSDAALAASFAIRDIDDGGGAATAWGPLLGLKNNRLVVA